MDIQSYAYKKSEKGNLTYADLLQTTEWRDKRIEIISRENNCCQSCKERCMDDFLITFKNNFVRSVPGVVREVEEEYNHFGSLMKRTVLKLVEMDIPKIAHIHHTYYIKNCLPWNYENNSLMLLCHDCHKAIHEEKNIPVYADMNKTNNSWAINCPKCNGTGYLHEFNYWHSGICFECNGKGYK